ncbi:MAG TPA: DUF4129 domain-containing protein [Ktedonobacterales bacterium]|jgi:hypothetical protein|nr:DUF4129 domain-containing protein [Ktedonobacterales bacterium]
MSTSRSQEVPTERERLPQFARQVRLMSMFVVPAGILLEALPLLAWLDLVAAADGAGVSPVLPSWWVVLMLLLAWAVGAFFRGDVVPGRKREGVDPRQKQFVIAGWALTAIATLFVSPAETMTDLLPLLGVIGLLLLVTYLWWRGLVLGLEPITQSRLNVRFLLGTAAVILAIISAGALQGAAHDPVVGLLMVLLLFEAFVGLTGLSLAHLIDTIQGHQERYLHGQGTMNPPLASIRPWIVTALGLTVAVVLAGLLLSLIISYNSLQGLLHLLQPVVDLIYIVVDFFILILAFVLITLATPILSWLQSNAHVSSRNPPNLSSPNQTAKDNPLADFVAHRLPAEWLLIGRWVLLAVFALLAGMLLVRLLRRFAEGRRVWEFEEECESLDAATILGGQVRQLVAGLLNRGAMDQAGEVLAPGTVRRAYRDLLGAASQAGLRRRTYETPDEFAQRLRRQVLDQPTSGSIPPDADLALATLTEAYDAARYDERLHDAVAAPAVVAAQATLQQWLGSYARASADNAAGRRRRRWFRSGRT